jgi:hypothetical protein
LTSGTLQRIFRFVAEFRLHSREEAAAAAAAATARFAGRRLFRHRSYRSSIKTKIPQSKQDTNQPLTSKEDFSLAFALLRFALVDCTFGFGTDDYKKRINKTKKVFDI